MFYAVRTVAILSPLLFVGCAATPSGKTFDSPLGDWDMKYQYTRSGDGYLAWSKAYSTTILDTKTATYALRNGRIYFHATDNPYRWEGTWVEDSAPFSTYGVVKNCETEKHGSTHWGMQTFQFNDAYNKFEGTWDRCGEGKKHETVGVR